MAEIQSSVINQILELRRMSKNGQISQSLADQEIESLRKVSKKLSQHNS